MDQFFALVHLPQDSAWLWLALYFSLINYLLSTRHSETKFYTYIIIAIVSLSITIL